MITPYLKASEVTIIHGKHSKKKYIRSHENPTLKYTDRH